MNNEDKAAIDQRLALLEARLDEITTTHEIVQREYAEALSTLNALIQVSCSAAESARISAEKSALAANYALHAAQKALSKNVIEAAEVSAYSANVAAEAAAQSAAAAANAAAAAALAIAHCAEKDSAKLSKIAADAAVAASKASSTAIWFAQEASSTVLKARKKDN